MAAAPAPPARQLIQGYAAGGFRIAGVRHEGSVLVLPERTLAWPVAAPEQITAESLAPIAAAEPAVEILLLGLGPRFATGRPGAARRAARGRHRRSRRWTPPRPAGPTTCW